MTLQEDLVEEWPMITFDQNFDAEEASASKTRWDGEMKWRTWTRAPAMKLHQQTRRKPSIFRADMVSCSFLLVFLMLEHGCSISEVHQGYLLNPGRLGREPDLIRSRCSPRRAPLAAFWGVCCSKFWLLGNKFWRQKSSPSRKDRSKVAGEMFCFFSELWGGKTFVWELHPRIFWTDVHNWPVGENWSIGSEMFLFPKERPGKGLEFQRKT